MHRIMSFNQDVTFKRKQLIYIEDGDREEDRQTVHSDFPVCSQREQRELGCVRSECHGTHSRKHTLTCCGLTNRFSHSYPSIVYTLTSSPVTDSTLRLFFILIGSFWAPGRSVPEPRQQSRWRARTGEVRGHCKVKPGQTGSQPAPIGADSRPADCLAAALSSVGWNLASSFYKAVQVHVCAPLRVQVPCEVNDLCSDSLFFPQAKGGRNKNPKFHSIFVWATSLC